MLFHIGRNHTYTGILLRRNGTAYGTKTWFTRYTHFLKTFDTHACIFMCGKKEQQRGHISLWDRRYSLSLPGTSFKGTVHIVKKSVHCNYQKGNWEKGNWFLDGNGTKHPENLVILFDILICWLFLENFNKNSNLNCRACHKWSQWDISKNGRINLNGCSLFAPLQATKFVKLSQDGFCTYFWILAKYMYMRWKTINHCL